MNYSYDDPEFQKWLKSRPKEDVRFDNNLSNLIFNSDLPYTNQIRVIKRLEKSFKEQEGNKSFQGEYIVKSKIADEKILEKNLFELFNTSHHSFEEQKFQLDTLLSHMREYLEEYCFDDEEIRRFRLEEKSEQVKSVKNSIKQIEKYVDKLDIQILEKTITIPGYPQIYLPGTVQGMKKDEDMSEVYKKWHSIDDPLLDEFLRAKLELRILRKVHRQLIGKRTEDDDFIEKINGDLI